MAESLQSDVLTDHLKILKKQIDIICDEKTKPQPRQKFRSDLQILQKCSEEVGIIPEDIVRLIDVVGSQRYGLVFSSKIIRCIIPRTVVPEVAVIKAISWVCSMNSNHKINAALPSLLVRWVVVVFPYLESINKLQALYNVFFYFIRNDKLMPEACHILNLLTRYQDVTLLRINELMTILKKVGNERSLIGLLFTYKLLRPDLLGISLPRYQVFFRVRDKSWQQVVQSVQERRGLAASKEDASDKSPVTKKYKMITTFPIDEPNLVDTALSSGVSNSILFPGNVPYYQIQKFEDLLHYVDRIQIPTQTGLVLKNNLLQYVFTYKKDLFVNGQFNWWLYHTLIDSIIETTVEPSMIQEIFLKHVSIYLHRVQDGLPAVDYFLCHFLDTWDGFNFQPLIFELISFFKICVYDDLYRLILLPLKKLFFRRGVYFKSAVLISLTNLVKNYIIKWNHLITLKKSSPEIFNEYVCRYFQGDFKNFSLEFELQNVVRFITLLCLQGLIVENDHTLLIHFSLWFHEQLLVCMNKNKFYFLIVPSKELINRIFLSDDAVAISRLCQILINYTSILSELKTRKDLKSQIGKCVVSINKTIQDFCNSIWRFKAFSEEEISKGTHLFDFDIHQVISDLPTKHLNSSLSFIHHPAFLGFATLFLRQNFPEEPPHSSLIRKHRREYFLFLREQKLTGLTDFLTKFIESKLVLYEHPPEKT